MPQAGVVLPDRHRAVRDRLLDPDAGLADRRDLHQGPARHRATGSGSASSASESALARADWLEQVEATPYERLLTDPAAVERIRKDGGQLFGDNCAACHGADGRGGQGLPEPRRP